MRSRSALLGIMLGCLTQIFGCEQPPTLAPVTGVVTLEKKPLPGGRITFEPVGDGGGKSAIGDVLPDGTFALSTFVDGDGVMPGTYYPWVMDAKEDEQSPNRNQKRIGIVQLKAMQFEVTSDGPNEFDVPMTNKDLRWAVDDD